MFPHKHTLGKKPNITVGEQKNQLPEYISQPPHLTTVKPGKIIQYLPHEITMDMRIIAGMNHELALAKFSERGLATE